MKLGLITASVALALAAGVACGQTRIWQDEIRREDLGTSRREKLTQTELKTAPSDLFNSLSNWTGGAPLTSDATKGKVVLIMTLSNWEPSNQKAFDRVVRLAESGAEKGLVVVVAHKAEQWDAAVKLAQTKNFKGLLAQDDGKLRARLMSDSDPDFYLIDRAGNMRFADIETDSINKAVELTLGESVQAAAEQADLLKAKIVAERKEFETPVQVSDILRPKQMPKVEFKLPDAGVYEKAAWPEKNKVQESIGANDIQGQRLPNADAFGQKEVWLTEKPDWNGKVLILDFWATWCYPCKRAIPLLEDMAKAYKNDLAIIAFSGQGEDIKTVERYLRGKELLYHHCYDDKETLAKAISLRGIPHMVVISSDGIVRWQGHPADPSFRKIVQVIMEVDPGVEARRKAETAALKAAGVNTGG